MTGAELLARLNAALPRFSPLEVDPAYQALLDRLGVPHTLELRASPQWTLNGDGSVSVVTAMSSGSLFKLERPTLYIQFTPSGTSFTLLIDVTLPQTWTFGASFETLKGGPLDELQLAAGGEGALVIATGTCTDLHRQGAVTGTNLPIPAAGMTFSGVFNRASPALAPLNWLLPHDTVPPSTGPIEYVSATGVVTMSLPLATTRLPALLGQDNELTLEVSVFSGRDPVLSTDFDGYPTIVSGIRVQGHVVLGVAIELTAMLRGPHTGVLELSLTSESFALSSASALANLLGGEGNLQGALPRQSYSLARVEGLVLGIGLRSQTLEFVELILSIGSGYSWTLGEGLLTVVGPTFAFLVAKPLASPQFTFGFRAPLVLGEVAHLVVAGQTGTAGPTVITGRLDQEVTPPGLVALVQSQLHRAPNNLPQTGLEVQDLSFEADLSAKAYAGEIEVAGAWPIPFGWSNEVVLRELRVAFAVEGGQPSGELEAQLAIASALFRLKLGLSVESDTFEAEWNAGEDPLDPGAQLTYRDIAIGLALYGVPDVPDGLNLKLRSAEVKFDSAAPSFLFTLTTEAFGAATLLAGKDSAGNWGYAVAITVPLQVALDIGTIVPLGRLVPPGSATIAIDGLRLIGASQAVPTPPAEPKAHEALEGVETGGLALLTTLVIAGVYEQELGVRLLRDDRSAQDVPPPPEPSHDDVAAVPVAPTTPSTPAQQAATAQVQRAFGPLQLSSIGLRFTSELELAMKIDAAVELGGLRLALVGLEASVPIEGSRQLSFDLVGLGVEYRGGGLQIGGLLAKGPSQWSGTLTVGYGRLAVAAAGAYKTVENQPSLFVFVWVDYPIGGPPAFFVTGLAGGFGFNRSLRLPAISGVADYPLVKGASGGDRKAIQQATEALAPAAAGRSWAAAGIRFSSFGTLQSSVLATMSFGSHVEIAVLGTSTLTIPASPPGGQLVRPVARATIALLADIDPSIGQVAIDAQLTPQSYVLSPEARLTGGAAFYSWFAPSEHAGDFVLTLGGYNPYFTKPAHYPTVPRLGLNWKVSSAMTIKGGMYFALTPAVVMVGGMLEATWKSGELEVSFKVQADFLVRFKPFSYCAEPNVSINVSYTVSLFWTTKKLNVQVDVKLKLWGPPFGGRARVDLSVISCTIEFGAPQDGPPQPIEWKEFRESFLPPLNPSNPSVLPPSVREQGFTGPIYLTEGLVTIGAPTGLLKGGERGVSWVVDPANVSFSVGLQIPSTSAQLLTATTPQQIGQGWNTEIGVGPMNIARVAAPSSFALEIEVLRGTEVVSQNWWAEALPGDVPKALWSNAAPGVSTQDPRVHEVLSAVSLAPRAPAPGQSVSLPLAKLRLEVAHERTAQWSRTAAPSSDGFSGDPLQTLAKKLTEASGARTAVLEALTRQGLSTASTVEVSHFAQAAEELLANPPLLRLLGELPPPRGAAL